MKKINFFFIRHGEGTHNIDKLYNTLKNKDALLTDTGKIQARDAGLKIQNITFDKVFCSPLKRCIETCYKILDQNKIKTYNIELLDLIREYPVSEFCNYRDSINEIQKFIKQICKYNFCYTNISETNNILEETEEQVNERIKNFINFLCINSIDNTNVLVISHNNFLRQFLKMIKVDSISFYNCQIVKLTVYVNNLLFIPYDIEVDYNETNIRVLTWNICWGCMSANETSKFDKTAIILSNKCFDIQTITGNNQCLNNIINTIKDRSFDFISLQEATNWAQIHHRMINNYNYIHTFQKNEQNSIVHLVTFYNKNKYIYISINCGNLNDSNKDIRPYHKILFQNKLTQEYYMFINIHNIHNNDMTPIEAVYILGKKLSNNLFYKIQMNEYGINVDNNFKKYKIDKIDILNQEYLNINVIIAGDFNDAKKCDYWKSIFLFGETEYSIQLNSSKIQPPYSCCTPTKRYTKLRTSNYDNDKLYGDYILTNSSNLNIKNMNILTLFNKDQFTSDHLPVEAIITKNIQSTAILQTQNRRVNVKLSRKDKYYFDLINLFESVEYKSILSHDLGITFKKYNKYKNKYLELKKIIN
jgi:broad specificity phosphatase PhoE/endonuclease/exonuclease/phosphatase family metal-dependent hydrolase